MKRRLLSTLLLAALTLSTFAGCSTAPNGVPSTPPPADPTIAKPTEGNIAPTPVELVMWDLRTEGEGAKMIDNIMGEFTKKYPHITVKRTAFKVDDLRNTIKPAINSGQGPDIFSYDAGAGYLGVLAGASMAMDMTPYAEKFGWEEQFHGWALDKTTYNGKLYGVANELEMLGFFYNKKIFSDNNVAIPNTYDEFLKVCDALKNKGVTPVLLTDKEQWPGFHLESMWLNSFVGADKVKAAINGEIPWTTAGFGDALDKIRELIDLGYVNKNPLSVGNDDCNKEFIAGNGAMRPTGSWEVGNYVAKMGENVGFFYLPAASATLGNVAPGGLGEAVVASAKTTHPEETMLFIDFMFSDAMIKYWYEAGFIPSAKNVDYSTYTLSPLFKEMIVELNTATNLGENIDVLMPPKVNDVTKNYVQEVLAGKRNGNSCMELKQKAFEEEIKAGNYTIVK